MIIQKIMNNNVVFAVNDEGEEIILVGRGLGFKKKPGQAVDTEKIEKTFALRTRTDQNKLAELLTRVSEEDLKLTDVIIRYAEASLGKKLKENVYITLTDHIAFAMERAKQKIHFSNALLWEIRHFYPQEFAVGQYGIAFIKKETGVELSEDEAGFIALHIANAHIDSDIAKVETTAKIIRDALKIISRMFGVQLQEDSLNYGRFVIHLKFFIERLFSDRMLCNDDQDFIQMIKQQYQKAYACAEKIGQYINTHYHLTVTDDELVYLCVHIKRIVDSI